MSDAHLVDMGLWSVKNYHHRFHILRRKRESGNTPTPNGVTAPNPVTTTRRISLCWYFSHRPMRTTIQGDREGESKLFGEQESGPYRRKRRHWCEKDITAPTLTPYGPLAPKTFCPVK